MTRRCELTGRTVQSGNRVSHSNRKTRHVWRPNLSEFMLISQTLKVFVSVRICKRALRSLDAAGGLDAFLLNCAKPIHLSPKMKRILALIKKKRKKEEQNSNSELTV